MQEAQAKERRPLRTNIQAQRQKIILSSDFGKQSSTQTMVMMMMMQEGKKIDAEG
jgi:hypothetical protein